MPDMTGISAREAAYRALSAYRKNGAWPDKSLGGIFDRYVIDGRDAALAWRILNGVMQNLILLDYYITKFSDTKKIEPQVLDILRISVYQIVFMDIPNNAAVNEGVKLTKKRANPRAAGFVNAVLRRISKVTESGMPQVTANSETMRLSIKYSHPEWLVGEFIKLIGITETEELLRANNAGDTPVTVQINTVLSDTETILRELIDDGFIAERHKWLEDCIEIRGAGSIEKLGVFKDGYIYVQDAAARLAVMAAGIKPGDMIIDACAAPGGKSFAAAIATGDTGTVIACDINEGKLRYIDGGAARMGLKSVRTRALDATVNNVEFNDSADVVIADVPCSGFGVIRKKPEIRYKKHEDIKGLPIIQGRILENVSKYVKPGGTLIYSTCTVLSGENDEVINRFLENNDEFALRGFMLPGIGDVKNGTVTLWQHQNGTDGFYIAKLRRRNDEKGH